MYFEVFQRKCRQLSFFLQLTAAVPPNDDGSAPSAETVLVVPAGHAGGNGRPPKPHAMPAADDSDSPLNSLPAGAQPIVEVQNLPEVIRFSNENSSLDDTDRLHSYLLWLVGKFLLKPGPTAQSGSHSELSEGSSFTALWHIDYMYEEVFRSNLIHSLHHGLQ